MSIITINLIKELVYQKNYIGRPYIGPLMAINIIINNIIYIIN